MTKLPVCSGEAAIRAFERAGWIRERQRGSHVSLIKAGVPIVLTVPLHREVGPGSSGEFRIWDFGFRI